MSWHCLRHPQRTAGITKAINRVSEPYKRKQVIPMSAEDLQYWASILRWGGLAITAIGLVITFGSHLIADKLIVVQRTDNAKAQERLKLTESELEVTKAKTSGA